MKRKVTSICQTENCRLQGVPVRVDAGKPCCDYCRADLCVTDPIERREHRRVITERRIAHLEKGWIPKSKGVSQCSY